MLTVQNYKTSQSSWVKVKNLLVLEANVGAYGLHGYMQSILEEYFVWQ